MKNTIKVFGTQILRICAIALVAAIGFSFAACKEEDDNPFIGTWKDSGLTVTCTANTWKAAAYGQTWSGPYTPNGNSADFTETNGKNFGTATVSGNKMTVASTYGTFYLTKQ